MYVRTIKALFYSFAFFKDCILAYPLYAVMFADRGLSTAQISSLFIVWSLTAFLLEVPSGSIADTYPRKYVLIAAQVGNAAAFVCWLAVPTYAGFLIGFILWGISDSLHSGTREALVYDELKRLGRSQDYTKTIGMMETLGLVAVILASFGASAVAHTGYTLIMILSVAAVCLSLLAVCLLPTARPVASTGETRYWHYLSEGVKLVFRRRKVLFILLFSAIVGGMGVIEEYYDLFFRERGFDNTMIAFWLGVVAIFGAIGSFVAHRFEGRRLPLMGSLLVWGMLLLAATVLPPLLGPLAIGLYVSFVYVIRVLFNTYLQGELDDQTRATATSVGGLFRELVALLMFSMFALVAQFHNYARGLQATTLIIAILAVTYGLLRKRYGQPDDVEVAPLKRPPEKRLGTS